MSRLSHLPPVERRERSSPFTQAWTDARTLMQSVGDLWPLVWRKKASELRDTAAHRAYWMGVEQGRTAVNAGRVLRDTREAIGLSLPAVAERVDVDVDYLQRVEAGQEVVPESFRRRLSVALGEWLVENGP